MAAASPEAALEEFLAWPRPRLRAWMGEWGPHAAAGAARALRCLRDGLSAHLGVPVLLEAALARIQREAPPPERRPATLAVLAACAYVRRWAPVPFSARAVALASPE